MTRPAAPSRRSRSLGGLTVGHAVDDLYQGAVPAMIPFLVVDRGYSFTAVSGLTLAATFLSSVAQPLFGVLADRRRLGWMVPAGIAVAGTGVGLSGLGDSYLLTWLAIALSGLGVAAYHPEASRAARVAAGGSARGMSVFALGGSIGFALAPLLVTPVLVIGGLGATPVLAVPALVAATVLTARRRRPPTTSGAAVAVPAHPDVGVDDWSAFRWLTGAVICRSICTFGLTSFLALHLTQQTGASQAGGNTGLTILFLAGAAGTLLGGQLADRHGRVRTVRLGYVLTVPGLVGLLLAPTQATAYACIAVLGVALYIPFSVHVTLGQEYLPQHIGTASGVTLGLAVSVGGIAAPLLGLLADRTTLTTALAVLPAVALAALLLSLRLPDPHRSPDRTT